MRRSRLALTRVWRTLMVVPRNYYLTEENGDILRSETGEPIELE